jgi:hypothetical protein
MQVGKRAVWSSIQDRQIMRLGHALLSVFVGKDRGSCGVKRGVGLMISQSSAWASWTIREWGRSTPMKSTYFIASRSFNFLSQSVGSQAVALTASIGAISMSVDCS